MSSVECEHRGGWDEAGFGRGRSLDMLEAF